MLSGFIIKIGANVIRLRASYLKKGLMNLVSLAKEVAEKKTYRLQFDSSKRFKKFYILPYVCIKIPLLSLTKVLL